MKYFASQQFWKRYKQPPSQVREFADKNYQLLKADPEKPICA